MTILRHLAPLLAAALACAESGTRTDSFDVTDSAGVAVATNRLPIDSAPEWRLSAQPIVTIGLTDGEDPYLLNRAWAGARLSDGRISLVNDATEIRYFDAAGRYERTIGRPGQGPGEFTVAAAILRVEGDTIVVWDQRALRLTYLAPNGAVARVVRLEGGLLNPAIAGIFRDGTILMRENLFRPPDRGVGDAPMRLSRFAADGAHMALVATPVWMRLGVLDAEAGAIGPPLFEPITDVSARDELYWVGTARKYEIRAYDTAGTIRRIVRWNGRDRRVTEEAASDERRRRIEAARPEMRQQLTQMLATRPVSPQFPAYERVEADASGEVWISDYPRPGENTPPRWSVFDREGRLIGRISLPRTFRLLDRGTDYVLGVVTDELGTERAQVYELRRRWR